MMKWFPSLPWLIWSALALSLVSEMSLAQEMSLLRKLVDFFGLSSNPSEMKGPGGEPHAGEVWVIDLATGRASPVATEGEYRSPIFLGDGSILALEGGALVRLRGGAPSVLRTVPGIEKLVGTSRSGRGHVLAVLAGADGRPVPATLSLDDGTVSPVPLDWGSEEDVRALAHLRGWERDYGDVKLSVRRVREAGLGGTEEWSDVFLVREGEEPVNLTNCGGADCGQPSLSPDGERVAFVKAEDW